MYPDLISKAAVLLYSLAKSQACNLGNKRIAGILLQAFLRMNGHRLDTTSDDFAETILTTGASDRDERASIIEELKVWLGRSVVVEGET